MHGRYDLWMVKGKDDDDDIDEADNAPVGTDGRNGREGCRRRRRRRSADVARSQPTEHGERWQHRRITIRRESNARTTTGSNRRRADDARTTMSSDVRRAGGLDNATTPDDTADKGMGDARTASPTGVVAHDDDKLPRSDAEFLQLDELSQRDDGDTRCYESADMDEAQSRCARKTRHARRTPRAQWRRAGHASRIAARDTGA